MKKVWVLSVSYSGEAGARAPHSAYETKDAAWAAARKHAWEHDRRKSEYEVTELTLVQS
jgi:hypothetical protein